MTIINFSAFETCQTRQSNEILALIWLKFILNQIFT
jgi:hypothetical protein